MNSGLGWFIYALGSGWGHLNRALSLAQVAAQDRPVHVLTNSPYAQQVLPAVESASLKLHQLPAKVSVHQAKAFVESLLHRTAYDCLIVDTFPRGLVGELSQLIPKQSNICHVLVHRDLNPAYIRAKAIAQYTRQHYDGILIPGECAAPLAHLPQAKVTAPWLSRSAADLLNFQQLQSQWNISESLPLVVVCGSGQPEELAFWGQVTEQMATALPAIAVRCLAASCPPTCSPDRWIAHWPGMDVLQLADVVVGGGGYNLIHECEALGKPLVAFAWPRRYDRQAQRIERYGAYLVRTIEGEEGAIATVNLLLGSAGHLEQPGQSVSAHPAPDKLSDKVKANCASGYAHVDTSGHAHVDTSGHAHGYANGVRDAISHIQTWRTNHELNNDSNAYGCSHSSYFANV